MRVVAEVIVSPFLINSNFIKDIDQTNILARGGELVWG